MTPTWHILGPGSIGSLFACHLQQAGIPVQLIGRPGRPSPTEITLQENLRRTLYHFQADDGSSPIQQLLITVKAHQTLPALQPLMPRINKDSLILLMQNGMGAWEQIESSLPGTTCLLATTTEGAHRPAPGEVIHAGRGNTFIGALNPDHQPRAHELCSHWSNLALDLQEDHHILQRLWQKLAINCAINPLTVIYDCPNGQLLQKVDALEEMAQICSEVERVMSEVLQQPPTDLFQLAQTVAERTGNNISSMLQDVRKKQETEIDYITGYLLQEAGRLGLKCPRNAAIYDRIKHG